MSLSAISPARTITDVTQLGTVLGIWAHPDDEAFLSAGLMAAARDAGQRVVCVTATLGEHGTDDPGSWPPNRMAQVRERELHASLAALGVSEHHLLGLTDGTCAAAPHHVIVEHLAHIVDVVAPDTIVTFGPDGMTGHEDHQTVSAWATDAHALAAPDARLLYATTTEEFAQAWEPSRDAFNVFLADGLPLRTPAHDLAVELRLDADAVDRKIVALRAQASQTTGLFAALGEDRVRRVVVDRDVRRGPRRPRPRAGLGHLAGGGMTTLHPPPPTVAAPVVGRAVRDAAPVVLAYAPFGLALGATLAATHLPSWIAWSSSPLLFGGAAQLLAVQMLDAGASTVLVVLGALVVNARMLLYSAALAPHTAEWPARWRWLGAYLLADPVYALAITRFTGPRRGQPAGPAPLLLHGRSGALPRVDGADRRGGAARRGAAPVAAARPRRAVDVPAPAAAHAHLAARLRGRRDRWDRRRRGVRAAVGAGPPGRGRRGHRGRRLVGRPSCVSC